MDALTKGDKPMSPEHDQIRFRTTKSEFLWDPATNGLLVISTTNEPWLAAMEERNTREGLAWMQKERGGVHVASMSVLEAFFANRPPGSVFEILEVIPAKDDDLPEGAIY